MCYKSLDLTPVLTSEDCGKCRWCCRFTAEDIWEAPLISARCKTALEQILHSEVNLTDGKHGRIFEPRYNEKGLCDCPALGEDGCVLGEERPDDCKVWPFRVMLFGDRRVITVSPECPEINRRALAELSAFVTGGFAERLFGLARDNPQMIKPYIYDYPILACEH